MQAAFLVLEREQRVTQSLVDDYVRLLPERVVATSLAHRHGQLDQRADSLVAEYLTLVSAFEAVDELRAPRLQQAGSSYQNLAIRMEECSADYERFLESATPELRRLGDHRAHVEKIRKEALDALADAHRAWHHLREVEGLESQEADHLLAKARVAGRTVESWQPDQPASRLTEAVTHTRELSAKTVQVAEGFPDLVKRLRDRATSLRTRYAAVRYREETSQGHLGDLRREFSLPNWADLDSRRDVSQLLARVPAAIDHLDASVRAEEWDAAAARQKEVEEMLSEAEELVDAPRHRLERLRTFKRSPEEIATRARFAVRDAQMLVMTGDRARVPQFAPALDALVAQIEAALEGVQGAHPDYQACLTRLERVQDEISALVTRYRHTARTQ